MLDQHADLLAEFTRQVTAEYVRRVGAAPATGFARWGIAIQSRARLEDEPERQFELSPE